MAIRSLRHGIFAAALLLTCCTGSFAAEPDGEVGRIAPKPRITVDKQTTYITEPLRDDGYPDYLGALNRRMSEGVTPENNAAVLLLEAVGPAELEAATSDEVYRRLGIKPLPKDGNYLISQEEWIKRWKRKQPDDAWLPSDEKLQQQLDAAQERPWSANEFPMVAEWVAANEIPLKLAIDAVKRPKYYWPYGMAQDDAPPTMIAVLLPLSTESRHIAHALLTRAMLRIDEGDLDAAWDNIFACRLLARRIADGCCLVEGLVGCAIDGMATAADFTFAHHGKLSAQQAKRFQADLQRLSIFPRVENKLEIWERYSLLDSASYFAREGSLNAVSQQVDFIQELSHREKAANQPKMSSKTRVPIDSLVDWNPVLRIANIWFDELVEVARISDRRQRRKAHEQFDARFKKFVALNNDYVRLYFEFFYGTRSVKEFFGRWMARAHVGLFLPAVKATLAAEDRTDVNHQFGLVVFALAGYRADHGEYPEKLDLLVPKYLHEIPDDIFAPEPTPIRYRPEQDRYALWTVHLNGIDENGASYEDDPKGDDHIFRPVLRETK